MSPAISRFSDFYQQFDAGGLANISAVYADDIVFEDPVHCIAGLQKMTCYFEKLMANTDQCSFAIDRIVENETEQGGEAFVRWDMTLCHPKLQSGRPITVPGVTYLKFGKQRIHYHRDYFDLGQMLYEQLPVLGVIVRQIKSRLAL